MDKTGTIAESNSTTNRLQTVLLGDDDEGLRQLLAEVLHYEGFAVIEAHNRREAVEIFEQQQNHIDFVVLDMSHACPTAVDALAQLRAANSMAKVLLLTGNSIQHSVEETVAKGFNAFIPKPFTVSELMEPLRRLVGGNSFIAVAA